MDESKTFLRNVTSLTTANVLAHVVTAIVSILVINHLGEVRYGAFKTALAFATVFLIFAETGVGARFLYDRSGDKSSINEHFGAALFLHVGPYIAVCLVTVAAAYLFRYSGNIILIVAIVSVAALFRTLGEVCEKVMTVYQQMHLTALLRSVRFVSVAVGGVLLLILDWGPLGWALVTLVSMFLYSAATFAVSLRFARPRFVFNTYWPTLAASYIFGLGAVFYAIYENVDQVMLSKMMSPDVAEATVGIYGAAYVLMMFTYTVPASFVASMEPVVFAARGDDTRLARLGNISSRTLGVLALPLSVGTILLSEQVRGLILPGYSLQTATALSVLALFGLFRFFNFPAGMLMAATGMQKRRVLVQAFATVFNISLNFALIPVYGLMGAAWATVATELFIFASYQMSLVKALPGFGEFSRFLKPLGAAAGMGVFVIAAKYMLTTLFGEGRFLWLSIVPCAALLYFGLLKVSGFFTEEERAFFARHIGRLFSRRAPS